jgi:hypothetical protein
MYCEIYYSKEPSDNFISSAHVCQIVAGPASLYSFLKALLIKLMTYALFS